MCLAGWPSELPPRPPTEPRTEPPWHTLLWQHGCSPLNTQVGLWPGVAPGRLDAHRGKYLPLGSSRPWASLGTCRASKWDSCQVPPAATEAPAKGCSGISQEARGRHCHSRSIYAEGMTLGSPSAGSASLPASRPPHGTLCFRWKVRVVSHRVFVSASPKSRCSV